MTLVVICIPMLKSVECKFFTGFFRLITEYGKKGKFDIDICTWSEPSLDKARHELVKQALEKGADYIWFIDSDMIIPPNALEMLIEADTDIVSGLYFQRNRPHYPVFLQERDGRYVLDPFINFGQIKDTGAVGMGCCLIKRKVFEKMPEPYFKFEWRMFHDILEQRSEDIYFCDEARKNGFTVKVHGGVLCGHVGSETCEDNYLMYRKKMQDNWKDKEEFLEDCMEYFKISYEEAIYRLMKGRERLAEGWIKDNPKTDEEIQKYYKDYAEEYIYDLTDWHLTQGRQNDERFVEMTVLADKQLNKPPGKILDYGAGMGFIDVLLYKAGYDVTYADIDCVMTDFFEFRCKKRGWNIPIIRLDKEEITDKYGMIMCFEVLEHLPDKVFYETIDKLEKLKSSEDSRVYVSASFGATKIHPMHLQSDKKKLEAIKNLAGELHD